MPCLLKFSPVEETSTARITQIYYEGETATCQLSLPTPTPKNESWGGEQNTQTLLFASGPSQPSLLTPRRMQGHQPLQMPQKEKWSWGDDVPGWESVILLNETLNLKTWSEVWNFPQNYSEQGGLAKLPTTAGIRGGKKNMEGPSAGGTRQVCFCPQLQTGWSTHCNRSVDTNMKNVVICP